MTTVYKPVGVCADKIIIDTEDGIIRDLRVENGCGGNSEGLRSLLKDVKIDDAIEKLSGIRCGRRKTSCPDQIAKALAQIRDKSV